MIPFCLSNRAFLEIDFSVWIVLPLSVELNVNIDKSPSIDFIFFM